MSGAASAAQYERKAIKARTDQLEEGKNPKEFEEAMMITNMMAKGRTAVLALFFVAGLCVSPAAFAQNPLDPVAPDGTPRGPLAATRADYKFAAAVMPEVIGDRATELWARVYRPRDISGGPYPLVIFLHGNHGTCGTGASPRSDSSCQYTSTGTCPAGFVVTPNHLGYAYLANRLASWGYIVVSINANRGITCGGGVFGDFGLNLARGRLVLRHLQQLSRWNQGADPLPASLGLPANGLVGKLDFNNIGLMGHSRGGEGMRAAYNLYPDPLDPDPLNPWMTRIGPANFDGIFEIGPVDGQTSRVLDANETVWNVLLPMCDGDVSNLEGIKPFDRMMVDQVEFNQTQKSSYTVWGTNHNFYNTEWQQSDSGGCTGTGNPALFGPSNGSVTQRRMGRASLLPFFRANVPAFGSDPTFNRNFNPEFILPAVATSTTRVDQGYTDTPVTMVVEDFDSGNPIVSHAGFAIVTGGLGYMVGQVPEHAPQLNAAIISWNTPGFLRTEVAAPATGIDISAFKTLDLRVSRQSSALNPPGPTNFSIRLLQANGVFSAAAQLNAFTDLRGPVGGPSGFPHRILQTARIPLSAFSGVALTQIQAVQIDFNGTASGAIYLTNLRLSNQTGLGATASLARPAPNISEGSLLPNTLAGPVNMGTANVIADIRSVPSSPILGNQPAVEIEVTSDQEFPARNELVVLRIGAQQFVLARYPDSGETNRLIFTLTAGEFAQTAPGDPVTVQYGRGGEARERWNFGPLVKR
jgi:hypothetical protein